MSAKEFIKNKRFIFFIIILAVFIAGFFSYKMFFVEEKIDTLIMDSKDLPFYIDSEGKITNESKIPDNWPKNVPYYKNADIDFSGETSKGKSTTGFLVTLSSTDLISVVLDFYKKELSKDNWKIIDAVEVGDVSTISALKENMKYIISISKSDEFTSINSSLEITK